MWKSVCCAVQGTGHRRKDISCQDKTFQLTRDNVHVIALADGAGSARLSHYGAERVVRTVSELLASRFEDYQRCEDGRAVKQELVETLQKALAEEAADRECTPKDLACTLLVAAVHEEQFLLAHIGDGVIGYLDGDRLKVASAPDNGEFSNQTTFVTSENAAASMRLFKGELKEKSAFVLMSDGTEQSLYHKQSKTLAGIIVRLMQRTCLISEDVMERQLAEAFSSVICRNTQDDCSIAMLARPTGALRTIEALDFAEQCALYEIADAERNPRRRVANYNAILVHLQQPRTVRQLARLIHLKPKYTRQRLLLLEEKGLIKQDGECYRKI